MELGKRHDTMDFCPRQLVTDLLRTCYRKVANLLHNLQTYYGKTGVVDFGLYCAVCLCVGRFQAKLFYWLSKLHGVYKTQCLEIICQRVDHFDNVYIELKSKGFHDMLSHRCALYLCIVIHT